MIKTNVPLACQCVRCKGTIFGSAFKWYGRYNRPGKYYKICLTCHTTLSKNKENKKNE